MVPGVVAVRALLRGLHQRLADGQVGQPILITEAVDHTDHVQTHLTQARGGGLRLLPGVGCVAFHIDAIIPVHVEVEQSGDVPQLEVVVAANVIALKGDFTAIKKDG